MSSRLTSVVYGLVAFSIFLFFQFRDHLKDILEYGTDQDLTWTREMVGLSEGRDVEFEALKDQIERRRRIGVDYWSHGELDFIEKAKHFQGRKPAETRELEAKVEDRLSKCRKNSLLKPLYSKYQRRFEISKGKYVHSVLNDQQADGLLNLRIDLFALIVDLYDEVNRIAMGK